MRQKSAARLQAESLRQNGGLSYREIEALTGINRSTLSGWLKDIVLTPEQEAHLQARLRANQGAFAARALPINRARHQAAREAAVAAGTAVADALPDAVGVHELALAMLYAGEGAKRSGMVQIANMDPEVLRYFVWALTCVYQIEARRIKFRLNLVEGARALEAEHMAWWCGQLGCARDQFIKSQFDARSPSALITGDYHGVCTVSVSDTRLQQYILGLGRAYMQRCAEQTKKTAQ